MNATPSRIPQVIDNGAANDWLEYADEPWGFVRIGDVVDVYPEMLNGHKASGTILSVQYAYSGKLSMICLSDMYVGVRWVDYQGAIYHHREGER